MANERDENHSVMIHHIQTAWHIHSDRFRACTQSCLICYNFFILSYIGLNESGMAILRFSISLERTSFSLIILSFRATMLFAHFSCSIDQVSFLCLQSSSIRLLISFFIPLSSACALRCSDCNEKNNASISCSPTLG